MKQIALNNLANQELGLLVAYKVNKNLSPGQKSAFLRKLRGYTDHSQYGRHHYHRPGLLAKKKIPYYTPLRGVIVIRERDFSRVKWLFSNKAQVYVWQVVLTKQDIKRMESTIKRGGHNE